MIFEIDLNLLSVEEIKGLLLSIDDKRVRVLTPLEQKIRNIKKKQKVKPVIKKTTIAPKKTTKPSIDWKNIKDKIDILAAVKKNRKLPLIKIASACGIKNLQGGTYYYFKKLWETKLNASRQY